MRRTLLASTALTTSAVLTSGAALAAPPPPVFSWTGCYVGVNAGGMSGHIDQGVIIPAPVSLAFLSNGSDIGFTAGGQGGCNWQYAQNWVLGFEGDINYARASRSQSFAFVFSGEDTFGTQNTSVRWLGTARARLGYAMNQVMLYVTGGLAFGGVKSSVNASFIDNGVVTAIYAGSVSDTRVGWVIGGGVERAFSSRVSGKIEYLHFDLGDVAYNVSLVSGTSVLPPVWQANAQVSGDIIRVGVNVKLP
jgi:outer membrane immunogenic protein